RVAFVVGLADRVAVALRGADVHVHLAVLAKGARLGVTTDLSPDLVEDRGEARIVGRGGQRGGAPWTTRTVDGDALETNAAGRRRPIRGERGRSAEDPENSGQSDCRRESRASCHE